jgi:hypothetical protein
VRWEGQTVAAVLASRPLEASRPVHTMKNPYGRSNFGDIRRGGFFYVDKTPFLPILERDEAGYAYVLFLRPRRFGKSSFLSLLEHYYDMGRADQFDALFSGHSDKHTRPRAASCRSRPFQ